MEGQTGGPPAYSQQPMVYGQAQPQYGQPQPQYAQPQYVTAQPQYVTGQPMNAPMGQPAPMGGYIAQPQGGMIVAAVPVSGGVPMGQTIVQARPVNQRHLDPAWPYECGDRCTYTYSWSKTARIFTGVVCAGVLLGIILLAASKTHCKSGCQEVNCIGSDGKNYDCYCPDDFTCRTKMLDGTGIAGAVFLSLFGFAAAVQSCHACCGCKCCPRNPD